MYIWHFTYHRVVSLPSSLALHSITALAASYPFLPQGFYSRFPYR